MPPSQQQQQQPNNTNQQQQQQQQQQQDPNQQQQNERDPRNTQPGSRRQRPNRPRRQRERQQQQFRRPQSTRGSFTSSVSASTSSSANSFPGDMQSASSTPAQVPPSSTTTTTTTTRHHRAQPQQQQQQQQVFPEESDETDEYRLLLSPMFAAMTRITEHLFLTGVGGMTRANFRRNHIDFVVNITTEAPFWDHTESMRLPLEDDVSTNILPYLDTAVDRIHEAIVKRNAHVLVHCIAGVSRSATVVIAYMMKYRRMDLRQAFNYCYNLRPVIRPNNGFMQQLISYEMQLFGRNTVWMSDAEVEGTQIRVPQFFIEEHPRLVILEMMRVRATSRTSATGHAQQQQQQQQQQPPSPRPQAPPPPQPNQSAADNK